ncbi:MAG: DUF4070 domain-containing protein [Cyanobacteriota bacterium]
MTEIARECIDAFDVLNEPSNDLRRIHDYSGTLGRQQHTPRSSHQRFFAHMSRPQSLAGALTLFWNQGVRHGSRWLFWNHL